MNLSDLMRGNSLKKEEFVRIMSSLGFRRKNVAVMSTTSGCVTDHDRAARDLVSNTDSSSSFKNFMERYVAKTMSDVFSCFMESNEIVLGEEPGPSPLSESRPSPSPSPSPSPLSAESRPSPSPLSAESRPSPLSAESRPSPSEVAFFQSIGLSEIPDCDSFSYRGGTGIIFDVGERIVKIAPITGNPSSPNIDPIRDALESGDPRAVRRLISDSPTLPAFTEAVCACALTEFAHAQLTPAVTPAYACVLMNARPMCSGLEGETAPVPALAIVMDRNEISLYDILQGSIAEGRFDVVHACLVQAVVALGCLQSVADFVHNDLHPKNLMAVRVDERAEIVYAHPGRGDFVVPTHGYVLRLIDFGKSRFALNGRVFCSADSLFSNPGSEWSPHTCWHDLMTLGIHTLACIVNPRGVPPKQAALLRSAARAAMRRGGAEKPRDGIDDDGRDPWLARVLSLLHRFVSVKGKRDGVHRTVFEMCELSIPGCRDGFGLLEGSLQSRLTVSSVAAAMTEVTSFVSEGPKGVLCDPLDDALGPYRSTAKVRTCADVAGCVFPILWNSRPVFDAVPARDLRDNFYLRSVGLSQNIDKRKSAEAVNHALHATSKILEIDNQLQYLSFVQRFNPGDLRLRIDDEEHGPSSDLTPEAKARPGSNPFSRTSSFRR